MTLKEPPVNQVPTGEGGLEVIEEIKINRKRMMTETDRERKR